jgi:hypothetical protein
MKENEIHFRAYKRIKLSSAEMRALLSKYRETTEGEENTQKELAREKNVKAVGGKYEDTTIECNSCEHFSCKQLIPITRCCDTKQ